MAHYEVELPAAFAIDVVGGPEFVTTVAELESGHESRNKDRARPKRRYKASFPKKLASAYDEVISFMEVIAEGRANTWRLRDPFDYAATSTQGVLTLQAGSPQTLYQMYKRRTYQGYTKDRAINRPKSGTITIYDNGVAMVSGFSIDYTTGRVNITSGTGPYTWAGEFHVKARFDVDPMESVLVDKGEGGQYMIEWTNIPIVEVFE